MNDDLFAALRDGVNEGSVPTPISGESINDYRFRVAHAGALIGIKWAREMAERTAESAAEAAYFATLEEHNLTEDKPEPETTYFTEDYVGERRPSDVPVTTPLRIVPPEQDEAVGV
jgi:hypothetical protein